MLDRVGTFPGSLPLPEILQLKDDVEESVIDGNVVLHSRSDLRGVKVSRAARQVLPLLKDGITLDDLCSLCAGRAAPTQRTKLAAFVGVLNNAGLLRRTTGPGRTILVRYAVWDLSKPLSRLGKWLSGSRATLASAFIVSVCAALALIFGSSLVLPDLVDLGRSVAGQPFSIGVGVAVVFAVVIPAHEFAHAVAAGACGLPTTRLVVGRRGPWPIVFCETPGSSLIPGRLVRAAIPAAGPAVDLTFGVLFGMCAHQYAVTPAAPYLAAIACASFMAFVLDFNPYRASDGSRVMEILFDDDTARIGALSRRAGLQSMTLSARCYLAASVLYLVTVVCTLGAFGVAVYRGLPQ